jgi:prolyl-tRNA editing enzyme YbaK/EbsC (Cys-tRNA(Pro) deacylase)
MTYHEVVSRVLKLLKENNCWYETFAHEGVRTSEEAAKTRPGYTLHQGAKAMIVKAKGAQTRFVMLVLPADLRFDNSKVKLLLNARDLRFASEPEVLELTGGVQPGAVPPFGNLFHLDVIADPGLFLNQRIVFNAGDRRFSVAMTAEDYKRIVDPKIASIAREEPEG